MAVPTSYLAGTKNLPRILEAIQKASVPQKFTYDWLKQLGFPSSNDRPIIPLLKAMRFIDETGVPLERYKRFRDATQAKVVLAEGIREAYRDVFAVDQRAQNLSGEQLKGIFARLSGKSDRVSEVMALTFKSLAAQADFSRSAVPAEHPTPATPQPEGEPSGHEKRPADDQLGQLRLHHDIHVHLPASTEIEVYDAIFRALRQNFA